MVCSLGDNTEMMGLPCCNPDVPGIVFGLGPVVLK